MHFDENKNYYLICSDDDDAADDNQLFEENDDVAKADINDNDEKYEGSARASFLLFIA